MEEERTLEEMLEYFEFYGKVAALGQIYKSAFKRILEDSSIPVEIRVAMWEDAPDNLKQTKERPCTEKS